jgi:hypothetical protein
LEKDNDWDGFSTKKWPLEQNLGEKELSIEALWW